jgi:hypothetical protein
MNNNIELRTMLINKLVDKNKMTMRHLDIGRCISKRMDVFRTISNINEMDLTEQKIFIKSLHSSAILMFKKALYQCHEDFSKLTKTATLAYAIIEYSDIDYECLEMIKLLNKSNKG